MTNASLLPCISVVMSTFNDSQYIREAINSILNQTFRDFEFIIIDDGSTDNTLEIIKNIALSDDRIKFISRENRGLAASLNEGLEHANGRWVARMDSDDISHPLRFEKQLEWLVSHPADVCGTWIQLFGERNQLKNYNCDDYLIKKEMLFGSPIGHATVLMRTSMAKELKYDALFERAEDYDFFERAASLGWNFTNIPQVLYFYRFHPKQTSVALRTEQQIISQKIRNRYWAKVSGKYNLTDVDIDLVSNLRSPIGPIRYTSAQLNLIAEKLLAVSDHKETTVIFNGLIPLYIRLSGHDILTYKNLQTLCAKYHYQFSLPLRIKILLLSLFRIRANSRLYHSLETFYLQYINKN